MRQLESVRLDRFNETEIEQPSQFTVETRHGRDLTYEDVVGAPIPAVISKYDGFYQPQLTIANQNGLPLWDESTFYPVGRLAAYHCRNLEVLADEVDIRDEYGHNYRSLSLKGSDFTDPHFFKHVSAAREYIIHGLQESLVIERVIRASNYLRSQGVNAEYVCGLAMPKEFPLIDNDLGIDSHTTLSLPELLRTLSTRFAKENPEEDRNALEISTEMIDRFKDCDYLVTYRAMDSPFRARDLVEPDAFEQVREYMSEHFSWVPAKLEYDWSTMDQFKYISGIFSMTLGINVGRMHKAGIIHGFLHEANLSALGGVVDLDSCRGEGLGLGDEPITLEQMGDDAYTVINSLKRMTQDIGDKPDKERLIMARGVNNFLYAYLSENELPREESQALLLRVLSKAMFDPFVNDRFLHYITTGICETHASIIDRLDEPALANDPGGLPASEMYEEYKQAYIERFGIVPPQYYSDERKHIVEALRGHSSDMQAGERRYLYSKALQSMFRVSLRSWIGNNLADEDISAGQKLCNIAYYSGLIPSPDNEKEYAKQIHDNNTVLLEGFVDELTKPRMDMLSPELVELLSSIDPLLMNRVGALQLNFTDLPLKKMPLLYLQTLEEYRTFLATIKKLGGEVTIGQTLNAEDFEDSLLVSDYRYIARDKLQSVMPSDEYKNTRTILFDLDWNRRPSILITGISKPNPKIKIVANEARASVAGLRREDQKRLMTVRKIRQRGQITRLHPDYFMRWVVK